ncbi:hypothetical protein MASR2M47_43520 [Draconibacterium sp.]|jgi:hypothetical protein
MKSKINISEFCGDSLTSVRGLFRSRASKLFLTLIFGLFLLSGINAQTAMSFDSAKQTLEPSSAEHLQSLVTNLHPNVYLSQGGFKTYGEGSPVVAICDAGSVNMLYSGDPVLSQVELINIKANSASDLPSSIDLTQMQGLTNLKYLMVVFAYDACGGNTDACLASKLEGIIQGTSSQITVLFKLSIPQ